MYVPGIRKKQYCSSNNDMTRNLQLLWFDVRNNGRRSVLFCTIRSNQRHLVHKLIYVYAMDSMHIHMDPMKNTTNSNNNYTCLVYILWRTLTHTWLYFHVYSTSKVLILMMNIECLINSVSPSLFVRWEELTNWIRNYCNCLLYWHCNQSSWLLSESAQCTTQFIGMYIESMLETETIKPEKKEKMGEKQQNQ